jgi:hypothetical protein
MEANSIKTKEDTAKVRWLYLHIEMVMFLGFVQ